MWNKSEAAAAAAPPERSDPKYIYSFGFPQIVRAHDFLCIAPPRLAHVFCHVLELIPERHMAFVHVSCGDQLRHMAKYMCRLGGVLYTRKLCASARFWGNPNLSKTVVASLKRVCISLALALLVPHRTTNRGFGTAVIQPKMAEIRSTTENREL